MKRLLIFAIVVAVTGVAAARLLREAAPGGPEIATYTVHKDRFVRRVTAEGNLRAVHASRLTAPANQGGGMGPMKIAWLAADGTLVKKGDVVTRFDPSEPEKRLREGLDDLDSATAKLAKEKIKSTSSITQRDSDAVLARDELDQTRKLQAKDELIFSRNQIIESQINEGLADAKQSHAERAKQIEQRLSRSNAAVIGVEHKKAELAVSHAQQALNSMQIVAPTDGVFVLERDYRGQLPKLGDSLWPGQAVAEIPLLDEMEANVYVLEVDGSGLAENQAADVVVEARPGRVFHGKIKVVEKLAQPRQPGSPVQYFGVVIGLEVTDRELMKPGQRVRATLVLDQEDALVVPRQAVVELDRKTVVYRKTKTGFDPVTVELGPATSGRVVIAKGLAAGDVVALRDPTQRAGGSDALVQERTP